MTENLDPSISKTVLDLVKPLEVKVKEQEKEQFDADLAEIAMLENRVQRETTVVYLDKEKKYPFRIRACLSEQEMGELMEMTSKKDEALTQEEQTEITYKILSKIAVNKQMKDKPEWFKENKHKYATQDILVIFLGYMNQVGERADEITKLQKFR